MSVPYGLRNVPDTEGNAKLECIDRAEFLFLHSVKCTISAKVQDSQYVFLASAIIQLSLEICLNLYEANGVPYHPGHITEAQYSERMKLIHSAIRKTKTLEGCITLGKISFRWRDRKHRYWVGLIIGLRESMQKWSKWCYDVYKG